MLPKLKYHETKKTKQTMEFRGLNMTDRLSEGELTACYGLTGERSPYLSPRFADRLAHTFSGAYGMTAADGKLYIAAGTELWEFESGTASRVMTGLARSRKQFAYISGILCIFPDKVYYRPETEQSGSLEHTERFTGFTVTENSITRTDGEDFGFEVNDGVTLSGCSHFGPDNRTTAVISGVSGSTLVFEGAPFTAGSGSTQITISRTLPNFEYVCEHDNRLWGVAGNRIYASWLGNPSNFFAYSSSHSQASWYADVGTDGVFTACVSCPSYIAFMKRDRVHKLYGSKPSNYRITISYVNGAEEGSSASAVVTNDTVIYNGSDGVYGYTGGTPEYLSAKTGRLGGNAVGVCMHGTYYIAATEGNRQKLYTYDLRRGTWLCDGDCDISAMAVCGGSVWYLTGEGALYELGAENRVGRWGAVLAPFVEDARLRRYPRIILKLWLAEGAAVKVTADNGSGKSSIYIRRADEDMRYEIPLPYYSGSALRVTLDGRGKCLLKGIIREYIE